MNRRQFINSSAALIAAGSIIAGKDVLAATSATPKPNKGRIGIQLYSVRNDLPNDFVGTLKKISDMGYSEVETYGLNGDKFFNYAIKDFRKLLRDMGMSMSSTHAGSGILPENTNAPEWDYWKTIAATVKDGGGKWVVQAGFPGARNVDDLKQIAQHFNRIGEVCKKSGLKFAYHNHHREFSEIEGEVILEYLIKNTDRRLVSFQLDMGHAVRGGADCLRLLREYGTRIPLWHASDYDRTSQQYVDVGKGDVPYKALFELRRTGGLQVLTVEQETIENIFGSLKNNFDYLKQFKWTKAG